MLDLDAFKRFNDALGHPAGDALLVDIAAAMTRATRETDRLYRYGGDEFAAILPGADRVVAHEVAERIRRAVRDRRAWRPRSTAAASARRRSAPASPASRRTAGRRTSSWPSPTARSTSSSRRAARRDSPLADPYLRALDETALALLDRRDQDGLLETIVGRATALLGTPHGWVDLLDPDARRLVLRVGTGLFADLQDDVHRARRGLGGEVVRTGQPLAVDDYDSLAWAVAERPQAGLGADDRGAAARRAAGSSASSGSPPATRRGRGPSATWRR